MIRFLLLIALILIILFILRTRSKSKNKNSNIYNKIIIAIIVLGVIFLLATSGRFILPQLLQILKVGVPFLTKFIGI